MLKTKFIILTVLLSTMSLCSMADNRYNFNAGWKLALGKDVKGDAVKINDSNWKSVTLPYAWNQDEAYSRVCAELSDTIMWYRKHFVAPKQWKGQRIFVEFEGVRFGAHVFINGHDLGWHENGVMAFGFDLTPYIIYGKDNVLSVYVDSDWKYHEQKATFDDKGKEWHSGYQWNDKNFYCNYGGINKNVWLHVMPEVYQTLPLYSNLGTTGVYVYAKDIDIKNRTANINVEAQVINSSNKPKTVQHSVTITDPDGKEVASFMGEQRTIAAGDTVTLQSQGKVNNLHFWSWGYGYLYDVKSTICVLQRVAKSDTASIRTGFRKTEYRDGMFLLNDRALQLKGFAQRSTNEWPALGISLPAWMSDYSNSLVLGCNGNMFRWMHVTPSKQDVESFDRLGLIMAMPAGDAEKDVTGRRWEQRCELMRDAIIYNRNNPSVVFYEGGNNFISEAHMAELKAIRDKYDPYGMRASGSRNMLDSKEAEYGGEMLYVNKSATKPMFMMEYNRDEGIRRYWDQWSYPYHKEGEGPLYRGARATSYNHNSDGLAVENIVRWNEYWLARPGQGKRVNAGGAKIIFSDSNTHARGEKNYRTSGDVDAMRIPKDSYFAHKVMWNGWVDTEQEGTYIIGHWNYEDLAGVSGSLPTGVALPRQTGELGGGYKTIEGGGRGFKPVYVCSTGDEVELFLNGESLGKGERSNTFLFTWPQVKWQPGTLRAVSYRNGNEVSSYELHTVGKPVALRMKWIGPEAPSLRGLPSLDNEGVGGSSKTIEAGGEAPFRADGSDIRICEIEAVDAEGRRHPLAHDMIAFDVKGEGEYLGGVSGVVSEEEKARNAAAKPEGQEGIISEGGHSKDNNGVLSKELMLEAGVIRIMVRSTNMAGDITLTATPLTCDGKVSELPASSISTTTTSCPAKNGFYVDAKGNMIEANWSRQLPAYLERGETPTTPSFRQHLYAVAIKDCEVPVNNEQAHLMYDDNEANDSMYEYGISKWSSDGILDNAWARFTLERPAAISNISIRLNNFRNTSYPLQVFAINGNDSTLVWEGYTDKNLGYSYLAIKNPVLAQHYEIRMIGEATVKEAFGNMTELAAKKNVSTKTSKSNILSIIEVEFRENGQSSFFMRKKASNAHSFSIVRL